MILRVSFWLMLLCFLFGQFHTQAQDAITLQPFVPVSGQINTGDDLQTWNFPALEGQVVSVVVEATTQGFDPFLRILNGDGEAIIANDDYSYPDNRDALLEAVTLPRLGTYTAAVTGFGGSTGGYRLTLLPGYARLVLRESFDGAGNWQAADEPLQVVLGNGELTLSLEGIQAGGVALSEDGESTDNFFAEVSVRGITGRNSWAAGMVLRQQTDGYYVYEINEQGQWRFTLMTEGSEQVLRDWTSHPAILPGETEFKLGVLANGAGFDVFYDDQFMGQVDDNGIMSAGRIGLFVGTANALNSQTVVRFDDLSITEPLVINGATVFPQQIIMSNDSLMVLELERRGLIPAGGELALSVESSFVDSVRPGVSLTRLGRGTLFRDFVLATTATTVQNSTSGVAGCGLILRNTADNAYTIAYLDTSGGYGVSERLGDEFTPGLYEQSSVWDARSPNRLLIIVNDDLLHYFVNGQYSGSLTITPVDGEVGNALINFDPTDTTCQFSQTWLWRWDEVQ